MASCRIKIEASLVRSNETASGVFVISFSTSSGDMAKIIFAGKPEDKTEILDFGFVDMNDNIEIVFKEVTGGNNDIIEQLSIPVLCLDRTKPSNLQLESESVALTVLFEMTEVTATPRKTPRNTPSKDSLGNDELNSTDGETSEAIKLPKVTDLYGLIKSALNSISTNNQQLFHSVIEFLTTLCTNITLYIRTGMSLSVTVTTELLAIIDTKISNYCEKWDSKNEYYVTTLLHVVQKLYNTISSLSGAPKPARKLFSGHNSGDSNSSSDSNGGNGTASDGSETTITFDNAHKSNKIKHSNSDISSLSGNSKGGCSSSSSSSSTAGFFSWGVSGLMLRTAKPAVQTLVSTTQPLANIAVNLCEPAVSTAVDIVAPRVNRAVQSNNWLVRRVANGVSSEVHGLYEDVHSYCYE